MHIQRLEQAVVDRIAAGEIVVRPANALKEMLENSVDAHASMVDVTVKDGGLKWLQISDNGDGIEREDLALLCERFATSKLTSYDDLQALATYGFRGEALASISHIARVLVVTRARLEATADGGSAGTAWKQFYRDGKPIGPNFKGPGADPRPVAGNYGTSVAVEDLFYNVPARLKAIRLKHDEYLRILDVVGKYAVHTDNVGFSLRRHGEPLPALVTRPTMSLQDRIRVVYGSDCASHLLKLQVNGKEEDLDQYGVVALTAAVTNCNFNYRKKMQTVFFINHRLVMCEPLKRALTLLYLVFLPKGFHAFAYVSLELQPEILDVNVHPTKREVRFLHEDQIIDAVVARIHGLLSSVDTSRTFRTQDLREKTEVFALEPPVKKARQENKLVRVDVSQPRLHEVLSRRGRVARAPVLVETSHKTELERDVSRVSEESEENEAEDQMDGVSENVEDDEAEQNEDEGNEVEQEEYEENVEENGVEENGIEEEEIEEEIEDEEIEEEIENEQMEVTEIHIDQMDVTGDADAMEVTEVCDEQSEGENPLFVELDQEVNEVDDLDEDVNEVEEATNDVSEDEENNSNEHSELPVSSAKLLRAIFSNPAAPISDSKKPEQVSQAEVYVEHESSQLILTDKKRVNVTLESITELRDSVNKSQNDELTSMLSNCSYIGLVDASKRLCCFQHDIKLYLCDYAALLSEFYYQVALNEFCNYGEIELSEPISLESLLKTLNPDSNPSEIIETLASMKDMFEEYFRIKIVETDGEQWITSLPMLIKGVTPSLNKLPFLLYFLGTKVDFTDEKRCLGGILKQLARFYIPEITEDSEESKNETNKFLSDTIFPLIKYNFKAPSSVSRSITQIADLPGLYRIFERC